MEGKMTLKAARVNAQLTLEDVSAIMQVSISTLSNWENNRTGIGARELRSICKLYRVDPADIFLPDNSNAV
jgi:transcriptional regulator with XRE-family HTH domain